MKNIPCFLFLFALGLVGWFVPASEASSERLSEPVFSPASVVSKNTVTGFIFDESRRPLNGVFVELLSDTYSTVSRTKTNGSGLYSFRAVPDGNFKIKVLPYGTDYEEQTRDLALVSFSPVPGRGAINEQVDFYLRVKKKNNAFPLAAPGVVFAQEVPENAEKLYEEGIAFLRDNKEKEGFEKLKNSLEIFPDYYLALDRLGTEYVLRGYYRPAYVLLSMAIKINPRSFSSTFGLGLAQFRLNLFDLSVETLRQAVHLSNESVSAHLWLGIALLQKGKLDESESSLIKANKLSKEVSAEVHWQLAKLYNLQKRFAESADELELFLKYTSEQVEIENFQETIKKLREKAASK